jgi:aspartate racemase
MRTLGLLGGMTWRSTAEYYKRLNEAVSKARGGASSAKIVLYSYDFAEVEALEAAEKWDDLALLLGAGAAALQRAGADVTLLCSNTAHRAAHGIEGAFLHAADASGAALAAAKVKRVVMLGTRFTMDERFFRDRIARSGVEVLTPEGEDRRAVDDIIFKELARGGPTDTARATMREVMRRSAKRADAILLACTDLFLVRPSEDVGVPVHDTLDLHVEAAVRIALD